MNQGNGKLINEAKQMYVTINEPSWSYMTMHEPSRMYMTTHLRYQRYMTMHEQNQRYLAIYVPNRNLWQCTNRVINKGQCVFQVKNFFTMNAPSQWYVTIHEPSHR